MHFRTQLGRARLLLAAALIALVSMGSVGCEKTPKERLRAAKGAVINEKPDIAEEHLEAVLAADSENYEARRLMGDVHALRGNYAQAEETLLALWTEAGFDQEDKELSTDEKSSKESLEQVLVDLYKDWAESLDRSEDPEKFEEVAKKGLEISPKKPVLNNMLVEFYESRAKTLVEKGEKLEAADTFEKILDLRTLPQKRRMAEERSTNLRFEANKKEMLAFFNDKAKPKLQSKDRWDEENEAVLISLSERLDSDMEQSVEKTIEESKGEKVDLKRRNKQHAAIICDVAMREQLVPALKEVIVEAAGIPEDSDFSTLRVSENVRKGVKIDVGRRDCTLEGTLPLDDVLKMGVQVKEQTRKAAEKAEQKKQAEGGDDKEPKAKAEKADDTEK